MIEIFSLFKIMKWIKEQKYGFKVREQSTVKVGFKIHNWFSHKKNLVRILFILDVIKVFDWHVRYRWFLKTMNFAWILCVKIREPNECDIHWMYWDEHLRAFTVEDMGLLTKAFFPLVNVDEVCYCGTQTNSHIFWCLNINSKGYCNGYSIWDHHHGGNNIF